MKAKDFRKDFNKMLKDTPDTARIIALYENGFITLSETIREILQAEHKQSQDLARLLNQFNKEYAFLYDNRDNVSGFSEAMNDFDNMNAEQKTVCSMFCKYRGDLITSDREAAAFMFALEAIEMAKEEKEQCMK